MWPNLFILGGGVSKNARQVHPAPDLPDRRSWPAQLRNDAGIIGAAIVAAEGVADAATTWDDLPADRRPPR